MFFFAFAQLLLVLSAYILLLALVLAGSISHIFRRLCSMPRDFIYFCCAAFSAAFYIAIDMSTFIVCRSLLWIRLERTRARGRTSEEEVNIMRSVAIIFLDGVLRFTLA